LAKTHDLHIVVGLVERVEHLVYNTAVLIGPDGNLIGKYRKVCLPREEVVWGVTPGDEYPVFSTRLGKVGLMICWDVHFPEVARNLSYRGAEIIALPIWGGNPLLASARAVENQVFLVTSAYSRRQDWMKTGVIDPTGKWIALAKEWGDVVVVEVDLDKQYHWQFLGDFRARIPRERPPSRFVE
jgi:predicted amidohydrolase